MPNKHDEKQALRRAVMQRRSALSREQVNRHSQLIMNRILEWIQSGDIHLPHDTIMSYSSFRNEVSTEELNRTLLNLGFTLLLPYTDEQFRIHPLPAGEDVPYRTSALGIREPDLAGAPEAEASRIDLVIMPGIVFDRQGFRIGFGKGCYDSFLPSLPAGIPVVAPAYSFQVLEQVPHEDHDIPVHRLFTEEENLLCRS